MGWTRDDVVCDNERKSLKRVRTEGSVMKENGETNGEESEGGIEKTGVYSLKERRDRNWGKERGKIFKMSPLE